MIADFTSIIAEDWIWDTTEPVDPEWLEWVEPPARGALRRLAHLLYLGFVLPLGLLLLDLPLEPDFLRCKPRRQGLRAPGRGYRRTVRVVAWRVGEALRVQARTGTFMVGRARDGRILACPLPPSWAANGALPGRVVVYSDPETRKVLGVRTRGRHAAKVCVWEDLVLAPRIWLGPEHAAPSWTRAASRATRVGSPYR